MPFAQLAEGHRDQGRIRSQPPNAFHKDEREYPYYCNVEDGRLMVLIWFHLVGIASIMISVHCLSCSCNTAIKDYRSRVLANINVFAFGNPEATGEYP